MKRENKWMERLIILVTVLIMLCFYVARSEEGNLFMMLGGGLILIDIFLLNKWSKME